MKPLFVLRCVGLAAVAAWLLGSCAASGASLWRQHIAQGGAGFLMPADSPPLEVHGRLRLRLRQGTTLSTATWQAWPGGYQRLLVRARITGFLVLEARWNQQRLLVIDYANQRRVLTANTPAAREALLQLDAAPVEWLLLLTGRISRRHYLALRGQQEGKRIFLQQEAASSSQAAGSPGAPVKHRLELGKNGLLATWLRQAPGRPLMRVRYLEYAPRKIAGGSTLLLPRRVAIWQAARPRKTPPLLLLVLGEFSPAPNPPEPFFTPPASTKHFAPWQ